MPRVISFIVLLAIVLLVGGVFFQVMAQFMVPLFLACVLVVVFEPLHRWILERVPRWPRVAALFTTVLIVLAVLVPLVWLGWRAYADFTQILYPPLSADAAVKPAEPAPVRATARPAPDADDAIADVLGVESPAIDEQEQQELTRQLKNFAERFIKRITDSTGIQLDDQTVNQALAAASGFAAKSALTIVQSAIKILVGLVIMVIAIYYFLADGPGMIRGLMHLSPLDARYERELLERFAQVSRAVVIATLLSAFVQGVLAGIGYYFALPAGWPIFLLTALTMVTAMIPFVGAAAMWILVCIFVYLHGELSTAIILAAYCTVIVSGIDNVIKPFVLHGQSNLHPLLALLSILGGVSVLGPVGIIVGPMIVSFLQALLNMLRKELEHFGEPDSDGEHELAAAVEGAAHLIAETAEAVERDATSKLDPAKSAPTALAPAKPGKKSPGSKLARWSRGKRKR